MRSSGHHCFATRDRRAPIRTSRSALRFSFRIPAVLVAAVLALFPAPVQAHPAYLRSDPPAGAVLQGPPQAVIITLTEPVEARFVEVAVLGDAGERLDRGDARRLDNPRQVQTSLQPLAQGVYTVRWRVLGLDGHIVNGAFEFGVGQSPPTGRQAPQAIPVADAFLRWVTLVGVCTLIGGVAFRQLVLAPLSVSAGARRNVMEALAERGEGRILQVSWVGFSIFLAASVVLLGLQTLAAGRGGMDFAHLGEVVFASRFGQLWLARMLLLSALGAVMAQVDVGRGRGGPQPRSARRQMLDGEQEGWWKMALALAASLALSLSLSGHAGVTEPLWLSVAADWIHLLAAAVWVGGLLHLGALWTGGIEREVLWLLARRFSYVALGSVALLAPTGLYAAWAHVPSPSEVPDSPYGLVLLAKLALIVPLLALGGWHASRALRPRPGRTPLLPTLLLEVALALGVIAAVGLLISLPPAASG